MVILGSKVDFLGAKMWYFGGGPQEWEERRRQNIEKMNEEMEKIAEYERNQRVRPEKRGSGGTHVSQMFPRGGDNVLCAPPI